eukprot:TRINITY_DN70739_c0_g1_i1.p1 TRINITY_DN70739_c0_g1~~TRINITY_DN70739_c0_g1_i1.p1  ORF type:complete len:218 (-),score=28.91 TRINITY_DN70739_c0_g1_i1:140-793(-)
MSLCSCYRFNGLVVWLILHSLGGCCRRPRVAVMSGYAAPVQAPVAAGTRRPEAASTACCACRQPSKSPAFDYICPACQARVCSSCIANLEKLACPNCGEEEQSAFQLRTQKTAIRAASGAKSFFGKLSGFVREATETANVAAVASKVKEAADTAAVAAAAAAANLAGESEFGRPVLSRQPAGGKAATADAVQYFVEYHPLDLALLPPEYRAGPIASH